MMNRFPKTKYQQQLKGGGKKGGSMDLSSRKPQSSTDRTRQRDLGNEIDERFGFMQIPNV